MSQAHEPSSNRYARCNELSRRVRWDIDRDVIRSRVFVTMAGDYTAGLEYLDQAGGILQVDLVTVRVIFAAALARYIKERLWPPSQKLRDLPDGRVELTVRVADTLEVRRWILGFVAQAEAVEPESLREALRAEAAAVVDQLAPTRRPLAVSPRQTLTVSPPGRRSPR